MRTNKICVGNYDRFWSGKILVTKRHHSTNLKITALEKHLHLNFNLKHKMALSRFRLSNHPLMIEKGRHLRIEKNERKCYFCKDKIEDEEHFLINCPLMSNEDEKVIKALGRFISDSLNLRDRIITYFFP